MSGQYDALAERFETTERDWAADEVAKRQPEVHSEIDRLTTAVEKMAKVTDVLSARLGIVTRQAVKSEDDPRLAAVPQESTSCELGSLIRTRRDDLDDIRRRLESVLDRLEV